MESGYKQRGGARIGSDANRAAHFSWPSARFVVNLEQLELSARGIIFMLTREEVTKITRFQEGVYTGIRIEHTNPDYPGFVVFWTLQYDKLRDRLMELGYPMLDEATPLPTSGSGGGGAGLG